MELPDPGIIDAIKNNPILAKQHLAVWADKLMANGGPEAVRLGTVAADMLRDIESFITAHFTTYESIIRIRSEGKYQEEYSHPVRGGTSHIICPWFVSVTVDPDRTSSVLAFDLNLIKDLD